ncbi:MAG: hypothetical protein ACREVK_08910 [Gammaproteobacteria bacterium]
MAIWILIVALAVLTAVGLLLWRHRNKAPQKAPKKTPLRHNEYHSVLIRYKQDACGAVKTLNNQLFRSKTAPTLPLPGCTAKQCLCSYVHVDDRRQDERRTPAVRFFVDSGNVDRRTAADRRSSRHT